MKRIGLFFILCLLGTGAFPAAHAQKFRKIHTRATLVDGHNDVVYASLWNGIDISRPVPGKHTDLPRLQQGGVDVQFFSIYADPEPRNPKGSYADANDQIDSLEGFIRKNEDKVVLARTSAAIKKGIKQKKLVALIGVEGGHMIESDLSKIDTLYERGMRYLTLTWNNSVPWATSAMDETQKSDSLPSKGLNAFGRSVIKHLNNLGVLVDLSHTGEQTFYDAIAASTKPVIVSHSSVYNLCPVFRNVKDDQIKAVAKNKGVICINFYSAFISKTYDDKTQFLNSYRKQFMDSLQTRNSDPVQARKEWRAYMKKELAPFRPTLGQLVDHIDYIVKLVGPDYVGLGSDYDGISSAPAGLDDVSTYPAITEELLKRGYSKKDVRKILGENVLRVIKANF